jgi:hypothetical protein
MNEVNAHELAKEMKSIESILTESCQYKTGAGSASPPKD